jgi:arsenate reductase
MAEGLVNHFLNDHWRAFSAGTKPSGYVHSLAIEVMAELDIDISGHISKSVDEFRGIEFDVLITVCDDAAETCPLWLGSGRVQPIGFPDPADASGSKGERLAVFRDVRNGLRREVFCYLSRLDEVTTKGEAGDTA